MPNVKCSVSMQISKYAPREEKKNTHPLKRNLAIFLFITLSILLQNPEFKPVPLKVGEEEDYMLALKQEMRGTMQRLPHNVKPHFNKAGEKERDALET